MQQRYAILLSPKLTLFATTSFLRTPRILAHPCKPPFPFGKVNSDHHHEHQHHEHHSEHGTETPWQFPPVYVEGEAERNCVHKPLGPLQNRGFWVTMSLFALFVLCSQNGIFYQQEHEHSQEHTEQMEHEAQTKEHN